MSPGCREEIPPAVREGEKEVPEDWHLHPRGQGPLRAPGLRLPGQAGQAEP